MKTILTYSVVCHVPLQSKITLLSPPSIPRILQKPIRTRLRIISVTNEQNSVINLVATIIIENTSRIVIKLIILRTYSNSNWTLLNREHQLNWIFRNYLNNTFNGDFAETLIINALSLLITPVLIISVICFGFDSMTLSILKRFIPPTTPTSHVSKIPSAINKLLFWKRNQITKLQSISTFNSTRSGETPTRSTLTLILYRCYYSFSSPIKRIIQSSNSSQYISFYLLVMMLNMHISFYFFFFCWCSVSQMI